MFFFLSKFLPLFVYPPGLTCLLLALAMVLRERARWRNLLIAAAFLVIFVTGNRYVAWSLVHSLESQTPTVTEIPQADVIVVLGGGTEAAGVPRPGVEVNGAGDRVLHAARLYQQGAAPHLLLSGGNIEWQGTQATNPALEMADLLALTGVPPEALWLEQESLNTYENAVYSARLLEARNIDTIILVTSAWHMPRAQALFEKQGLTVIPAPADFVVTDAAWQDAMQPSVESLLINLMPSASNINLTTLSLKEYLGMLIYRLRGWI
ncbi:MAG: YdcF family protein [Anaerolineae bacterium]|nr:YdcF family protein [Anaerolineae bacterium]